MPRWPESLSVLRERPYRLLFAGQAVSLLGDSMVNVSLAFAVIGLGGSATEIGLVFAARSLALIGCLLAGGVVADRVPRRTVLIGADLVRVASQGALAAALILGEPSAWVLAALSTVTGAATGFFNPASTGFLPSVVSPERLQQANALRGLASSAGRIAGPIVAGVLVATAGAGWALAVDAATFAVSAAFLARIRAAARRGRAARLVPRRPARGLGRVPVAHVAVELRRVGRVREPALRLLGRRRAARGRARPRWRHGVGDDHRRVGRRRPRRRRDRAAREPAAAAGLRHRWRC